MFSDLISRGEKYLYLLILHRSLLTTMHVTQFPIFKVMLRIRFSPFAGLRKDKDMGLRLFLHTRRTTVDRVT